eukprot:TRINITY_DN4544_c0_g1_i1.p1 TRINITY_DN4544_c0_g1~~TRINITY_DN4544_c0_g1_i1.p1  ORF type:complete len:506 (-),score=69.45 TRINITY_DN4544_c0_g1_i1:713-2230(-)
MYAHIRDDYQYQRTHSHRSCASVWVNLPRSWKFVIVILAVAAFGCFFGLVFLTVAYPESCDNYYRKIDCGIDIVEVYNHLEGLYKNNRDQVLTQLQKHEGFVHGTIFMQGGSIDYNTREFKQNPFFLYMCGISLPDCALIVDTLTEEAILFIPENLTMYYSEDISNLVLNYDIDKVLLSDDIDTYFSTKNKENVYIIADDSTNLDDYQEISLDSTLLEESIKISRTIKSLHEINLMQAIGMVSSKAHQQVMNYVNAQGQYECKLQSVYMSYASFCGLKHVSHHPIIAGGSRTSIPFYMSDNGFLGNKDLIIIDIGSEYASYGVSITRTYPISGTYTVQQMQIYELILSAQELVLNQLTLGASFSNITASVEYYMADNLVDLGILRGNVADIVFDQIIPSYFYPMKYGRHVGLEVPDVGNLDIVEEGMVFSVSAGIYFNQNLCQNELLKQYLVLENWLQYQTIGGMKVEDTVAIVNGSLLLLTNPPKTLQDLYYILHQDDEQTLFS